MGKPQILVPRPSEAEGHPITELLLDAGPANPKIMVNDPDVELVAARLREFLEGDEPYLEFCDLFGEPQHLTRHGAQHVICVGRAFARHVPAHSDYFDIARIGPDGIPRLAG